MDTLPPEMFQEVSKYLSTNDLASCCAVSRHWRFMFNEDSIWKHRCRHDLVDYLMTTPCKVDPPFTSPEPEGSTLSPICFWWLAYMRENHLWNNWRTGNYQMEKLTSETTYRFEFEDCRFEDAETRLRFQKNALLFGDRYLILFFYYKVEVWDVTAAPVRKLSEVARTIPLSVSKYSQCVGNNMDLVILVNFTAVQVLRMNEVTHRLEVIHMIFFEMDLESFGIAVDEMLSCRKSKPWASTAVVGSIFMGVQCGRSIHIWNLETGKKLKKEPWQVDEPYVFLGLHSSNTSENVAVVAAKKICRDLRLCTFWDILYSNLDAEDFIVSVYSPKRLTWLPFTWTFQKCKEIGCMIHERFLAVFEDTTITVMNYLTSQQILTVQLTELRNFIVVPNGFVVHVPLLLINPHVKPRILRADSSVNSLVGAVSGNFLQMLSSSGYDDYGSLDLFEMGSSIRKIKTVLGPYEITTNRTSTKITTHDGCLGFNSHNDFIWHFW